MSHRKSQNLYKKKLSAWEAKEHKLLILKSHLNKFPSPGNSFSIQFRETTITTMIISSPCVCRGLDNPHAHYSIDLKTLWDEAKLLEGQVVSLITARKGLFLLQREVGL